MPNAIITGATQGIGKAIAEKLLSEGFSIAICARSEEDLNTLKKEWAEQYPQAHIHIKPTDLARKEEVIDFAGFIQEQFDTVDILVNNAGIFTPGTLAEEAEGHLEVLMNINLFSAYHITRRLLPNIRKSQKGHIFNICSVASLRAYPNGGSYGITKYALLGFSDNLREELKDQNIRVTSLCPGATYSRSWEHVDVSPERMMEAKDVADTLFSAYSMSAKSLVETVVMRPQLGDL